METANSLFVRFLGVLRAPRTTLKHVSAAPRWTGILLATFIVSAVPMAVLLATETGRLALLDQWERTAVAFGHPPNDAEYAALLAATDHGFVYALVASFIRVPLLALGLSAAIHGTFRFLAGVAPTYTQVLAVVAHAGVVLAVRQLVAAPVAYARETLASPASLSMFVPGLNEASPVARFFAMVDVFVVWWIVVLAIGLSILYRRPVRRLLTALVATYALVAGTLAIVMALTGGTS